jgi:hypothetical protein
VKAEILAVAEDGTELRCGAKGLAWVGAVIDAVGKRMAQPGKQLVDGSGDNPGPIAILDVGRMDYDTHYH